MRAERLLLLLLLLLLVKGTCLMVLQQGWAVCHLAVVALSS
jgi:hypothetical protein